MNAHTDPETMSKAALVRHVYELRAQLLAHDEIDAEQANVNLRKAFGLTVKEAEVLRHLSDGRTHTKDALLTLIYEGSPDEPEIKILDVFVCKIRRKLRGSGVEIKTIWGTGYCVDDTSIVKKAMAGDEIEWDQAVREAPIGKPVGANALPYGTIRQRALAYLREQSTNDVARVTTRAVCVACGNRMAGSGVLRMLEKSGFVSIENRITRKGGVWVVRLTEKAA